LEVYEAKICSDAVAYPSNNEALSKAYVVDHEVKRNETARDVNIHVNAG
jgi:hypothetical protein